MKHGEQSIMGQERREQHHPHRQADEQKLERSPVGQGCRDGLFPLVVLRVQQAAGSLRARRPAHPLAVQPLHCCCAMAAVACSSTAAAAGSAGAVAQTCPVERFKLLQQLRGGLACRWLGLAAAVEAACRWQAGESERAQQRSMMLVQRECRPRCCCSTLIPAGAAKRCPPCAPLRIHRGGLASSGQPHPPNARPPHRRTRGAGHDLHIIVLAPPQLHLAHQALQGTHSCRQTRTAALAMHQLCLEQRPALACTGGIQPG